MPRTSRPTSNNYDFPVVMEELKTSDGQSAGFWGTRRTDTGKVLGVTSDKYGLLLNSTLVDSIESVLTDKGLKYNKDVKVARDGATMYAEFNLPENLIGIPGDGNQDISLRITGRNSYDRSCFAGLDVAGLREVCTNGMKALRSTFSFNQKHSSKLDLSGVSKAIDSAVSAFRTMGEDYVLLADTQVTTDQGDYLLQNLRDSKVLSESLRKEISSFWKTPRYTEDEGRNLYNVYNAATLHLTSEAKNDDGTYKHGLPTHRKRYEYANKVSETLLRKLTKAAKDRTVLHKLIKKPAEQPA